ncbi:hypothetical protein FGG08_000654 [Glutinoglossum americanum]|uniref:Cytochrome P450 n=1 Tax=Glutinoglossum americanum TaxID=1670608 RepID=A0A9P8ICF8_9PEZI|nr:hypothetical protein FGG08_000654 [Glutinoglossum americanum]
MCSPHGRLLRVRFGSLHVYLLTGTRNVQKFFRSSRSFNFENLVILVTQKILGLPRADAEKLSEDNSGRGATPFGEVGQRGRIWQKIVDISHANLHNKESLCNFSDRWISEFLTNIEAIGPRSREEWIEVPIYEFVRRPMLFASVVTIMGPRFLEECKTVEEDLWAFDRAFVTLLVGAPRFLCRQGWDARNRLLAAISRWLARAWDEFDWQDEKAKSLEWEENFGHKIVRERELALAAYGLSLDGRATFEFGLLWASVVNSVPATGWVLIQILRNPDLYHRVRAEIRAADMVTVDKSTKKTHVNLTKLDSLPLLLSVYLECLRLYMTIIITRTLRTDLEMDGYTLRAGNNIITPSCLAHYNETIWSTPEHPADAFWAERFLHKAGESEKKDPSKKDPGDFFPFGGGLNICPGRHRGKAEILSAVALLLVVFDFDFVHYVDSNGRPTSKGPEHFNIEEHEVRGVAQPDRDVVVRMRRAE